MPLFEYLLLALLGSGSPAPSQTPNGPATTIGPVTIGSDVVVQPVGGIGTNSSFEPGIGFSAQATSGSSGKAHTGKVYEKGSHRRAKGHKGGKAHKGGKTHKGGKEQKVVTRNSSTKD